MKNIISVIICLFVCNCFAFAGEEVVYSYFYPNGGQFGNVAVESEYPVTLDPVYPVVLDPNWPVTLTPDFPDTQNPEFPEVEVKPVKEVKEVLKEEAENAMKQEKEHFKVALEKLMKQNLFDFDSDVIKDENFENLDAIAEFLKEYDNIKVKIEGHTDNIGSEKYNKNLSERRAKSVGNYLISKGVDESRIITEGFGFAKPVASNDTEEGRAQNRRTEMIFKLQQNKSVTAAASETQNVQEKAAQEVLEEKEIEQEIKEDIDTEKEELSDLERALRKDVETTKEEVAVVQQEVEQEAEIEEEELSSDLERALRKDVEPIKEEVIVVQQTVEQKSKAKEEKLSSDLERALRKDVEHIKEEVVIIQQVAEQETEAKEEELSDLEKALRRNAEMEQEEASDIHQALKKEVKSAIEQKKNNFSIALDRFSKESLFEFGSATIMEESFENLDVITDFLKEYDDIKVKIEGHTDNVGSEEYNKVLSEKRAKSVKNYLTNKGIDSSRITTEGLGSSKPIASNDTEEGQAQNRRTEIIFQMNK